MKDKRDLAQGWLTKAESDLAAARWILDSLGPYDTAHGFFKVENL